MDYNFNIPACLECREVACIASGGNQKHSNNNASFNDASCHA